MIDPIASSSILKMSQEKVADPINNQISGESPGTVDFNQLLKHFNDNATTSDLSSTNLANIVKLQYKMYDAQLQSQMVVMATSSGKRSLDTLVRGQ